MDHRLSHRQLTLDRYDAIMGPVNQRLTELRERRAALDDDAAAAVNGTGDWAARWDNALPQGRRDLLRMALRGRALVVGPVNPADRANVTARLTVSGHEQ
jgi:hypothetical protein